MAGYRSAAAGTGDKQSGSSMLTEADKRSWIRKDVRRFSRVGDASAAEILAEAERRRGRRATSDHVATCLLRHELPAAVSVRREQRVARNRRRVVIAFAIMVLWWVYGWFTL